MRKLLGFVALGTVMASPAWALQPLTVVYPPTDHKTTAAQIFLLGTAPPTGEVVVNGKPINRSPAGHFAPSFPLKLGDNIFTVRHQNQQVQITVKRLATTPEPPVGLAFGLDSLTPSVDIARLPGELICFSAIAPAQATVTVHIGDRMIPLLPQSQQVHLPANSAALTGLFQPSSQSHPVKFQGCTTAPVKALESATNFDWGKPEFQLTLDGKTTSQTGAGKITILSPARLAVAEVTADSGVARTGASTDYSRLTPLPKGTQATIIGREGDWLRLDYGGWINSKETRILQPVVPPRSLIRSISTRQVPDATEVIFPLQVPVPVSVQQGDRTLTLTLYNTTAQTDVIRLDDNPVIYRLDWQQAAPAQVQYTFNLKSQQQWGYQLRYEGTSLVLSLRHPPGREQRAARRTRCGFLRSELRKRGTKEQRSIARLSSLPLAGIKILLDPGHGGAESGALGPTGYPEKDLNLIVAKLVRDQLVQRGATVYMTRESDRELSLPDRVAMIERLKPAIAISIHHNSLPDEGDAMHTQGVAAFWYNAQAHNLAVFLHNYIVSKLDRPDYGVFWDNLALVRPTSAPSVLVELGFMSNPLEFEWLMKPSEQKKTAEALAQGITEWFRKE